MKIVEQTSTKLIVRHSGTPMIAMGAFIIFCVLILMLFISLNLFAAGEMDFSSLKSETVTFLLFCAAVFIFFFVMGLIYIYQAGSFKLEIDKDSKNIRAEEKNSIISSVNVTHGNLEKLDHIEARAVISPFWSLKKAYLIEIAFKMKDGKEIKVGYHPAPLIDWTGWGNEKMKIKEIADFAGVRSYWISPDFDSLKAFAKASYFGSKSLKGNEIKKVELR